MKPSKRIRIMTRSVTAKVTAEHELALKQRAKEAGITVSEYARRVILGSLEMSSETRLIVTEVLALRKIFLLLQIDLSEGNKLTPDRLRYAVEQAEATKLSMAENRIVNFSQLSRRPSLEAPRDE